MSEASPGPGWWQASDGRWYAPELHPQASPAEVLPPDTDGVFFAADDHIFPTASNTAFPPVGTDQLFPAATGESAGGQAFEYPSIHYPELETGGAAKSRVVAGVLAILLGWLGVHRFYLGYKKLGILMLALTVVSLGRLASVAFVWGLAEGILIFAKVFKKDAYGVPLE